MNQIATLRVDLRVNSEKKIPERRQEKQKPNVASAGSFFHARPKTPVIHWFSPPCATEYVVLAGATIIITTMSTVKKLLHTRYRVNDLEKTVRFYVDVLGLKETRRHKSPRGSELVFLKAPGSEELIEVCYFPSSGPVQVQTDLTHLAFQVDNLAEFGKHLEKHGLKYSDGPYMKENGSGFAFVDAPEGYEIELMQLAGEGY
jgi:lactoylglutathione lyase